MCLALGEAVALGDEALANPLTGKKPSPRSVHHLGKVSQRLCRFSFLP
jgi:hypothetical protein